MIRSAHRLMTLSVGLLGLLPLVGCLNKEIPMDEGGGSGKNPAFSVITNIENRQANVGDMNINGDWVDNMTVFIFKQNALDNDGPLLVKTMDGNGSAQGGTARVAFSGDTLRAVGISFTGQSVCDIYVLANYRPANFRTLTKSQIVALSDSVLPSYRKNADSIYSYVPMTGKYESYTFSPAATQTAKVSMIRSVSRLDLTIVDGEYNDTIPTYSWSLKSVKIYNDRTVMHLWKEGLPSIPVPRRTKANGVDMDLSLPAAGNTYSGIRHYLSANEPIAAETSGKEVLMDITVERQYRAGLTATADYTVRLRSLEGVSDFERNTIVRATVTLRESLADLEFTIVPWNTVAETIDIVPISPRPQANSYILPPGRNTILIPVSQANSDGTQRIAPTDTLTAEMVWADVRGAASGKGIAMDAALSDFRLIGIGERSLLQVTSGTQSGNATIAVKKGANILWSWHIWVTDYDPEKPGGQRVFTNTPIAPRPQMTTVFMDRNLGAMSDTCVATTDHSGYGLYYQWGRKDPFFTELNPNYDANGNLVPYTTMRSTANDMTNAILRPTTFILSYRPSRTAWNPDFKSINDPCPYGWRVAKNGAWDGIQTMNRGVVRNTDPLGRNYGTAGFYPTAGFVAVSFGGLASVNGMHHIWSADLGTNFTWSDARGSRMNVNTIELAGHGIPVRCVKTTGR